MSGSSRRRFLTTCLALAGTGLAGCTDAGDDGVTDPEDDGGTDPGAENRTETGSERTEPSNDTTTDQETDDGAESGGTDEGTDSGGTDEESQTAEEEESQTEGDSEESKEEPDQEPLFPGYETTEVRVETPDGEELGSLTAAIAESREEWKIGLSDTESLPEDWGMLFVSGSMSDREFWMKDMDFGLDIVFVDDEKRITGIHHAPAPGPDEDGTGQRYPGRGQYVLEVNHRWTERYGVTEGDVLQFEQ